MEAKDQEDIKVVLHFSHMFSKFVKPQMEAKYAKENNGGKMGFHTIDKDGKEKLFDDIIIENGTSIKREYGTK
jgi:hypothetical protein